MTSNRVQKALWDNDHVFGDHIISGRSLTKGLNDIYEKGEDRGLSTDWTNLDQFYTVKTGELCIVTGVPSHGKSEWLDALAHQMVMKHKWKWMYFSPENQPYQRHARKLIERYIGEPVRRGNKEFATKMDPKKFAVGQQWVDSHFKWCDISSDSVTIDVILKTFAHGAQNLGIKGFIIDPWNEIEHKRGEFSETEYISLVLSTLRDFTRYRDVALFLVAHPAKMNRDKRTGEYPIPSLWDISGSANWRNKADVGIVVHRPSVSEHICDVHVLKVRFKTTGTPGSARFDYDFDNGRFSPTEYKEGEK